MNNFANQFDMAKKIEELQSQLEAEKKKVAVLVECVEFYGDEDTWSTCNEFYEKSPDEAIAGKKARETLGKIKEIK